MLRPLARSTLSLRQPRLTLKRLAHSSEGPGLHFENHRIEDVSFGS